MKICNLLFRRKILSKQNQNQDLSNKPVYNDDFDLLGLGVNSTLSFGFYIVIGFLVISYAGRAAIVSVLVASLLAIISGLCYAEFGARIREEASSYIYTYVCLGEIIAFIIGWTIILEFITGIASLCRALTCYIDFLSGEQLINAFQKILTIEIKYFSTYVDFLAMGVSALIPIILLLPIVSSMKVNKALLVFNVIVCIILIATGATKADISNWQFTTNNSESVNGFFSFGKDDMFRGILISFCAFVSPEFICGSRKGLRNVNKNTLNSMIFSIGTIALCMSAMCIVITLMIPDLDPILLWTEQKTVSFLAYIFKNEEINIIWASWLAGIGGVIEICCSIYYISILLPGILNQMVHDSLLFKFLDEKCQNANYGTFLIAIITGLAAAFFSSKLLLNLLALGIVLTCTTVAVSVLILRYTDGRLQKEEFLPSEMKSDSSSNLVVCKNHVTFTDLLNQMFNKDGVRTPTPVTSLLVKINVLLLCIISVLINLCFVLGENSLYEGKIWIICVTVVLAILILIVLVSISFQPTGNINLVYMVPLLPYVPTIFIFVNIYLVLWLDYIIWIVFAVWIIFGLCVYFICFKIYKRYNDNSVITLNRTILNGKMNFAYENQIHFEEADPVSMRNSIVEIKADINNFQKNNDTQQENSVTSFSNDEDKIEEYPEDTENKPKANNHIQKQETKEYLQGRASSATHVLAMLDEILSNENSDPDDALPTNNSQIESKRKISVETESSNSVPLPTEHLALVHCEDEKLNPTDSSKEINENVVETSSVQNQSPSDSIEGLKTEDSEDIRTVEVEEAASEVLPIPSPPTTKDEIEDSNESDNEDIYNISNILLDHILTPKTPNVSRNESFMHQIQDKNNGDSDFVNKLNQLLQEQLQKKPRKKGLYKPENYEDEENERDEPKLPQAEGLLALLHKEMREKHKLNSQISSDSNNELTLGKNATINENTEETDPDKTNNIRKKLEEILQNHIAEQKFKSTIKTIPKVTETLNQSTKQEETNNDKNDISEVKTEDVNINKNEDNIKLDKEQDIKPIDKRESIEQEPKSVASIKQKLNEIFSRGPQHYSQVNTVPLQGIRKHVSAPSLVEMEQAFEMDIDTVVSEIPPPPPRPVSKTLSKEAHKSLMNNVFKTIELRRNSSTTRNEGSFLAKLQQQNEKLKRSSVLPIATT